MRKVPIFMLLLAAGLLLAETVTISVRETRVRSQPKFYARAILDAERGDQFEKLGESRGWFQVKTPGGETGWVHSSAVVTKKLDLSSGGDVDTGASADEVALAGKGFNREVEAEYRENNPDLDFTWVDRMEQIEVPEGQMESFLREGKLGEYGGGQ